MTIHAVPATVIWRQNQQITDVEYFDVFWQLWRQIVQSVEGDHVCDVLAAVVLRQLRFWHRHQKCVCLSHGDSADQVLLSACRERCGELNATIYNVLAVVLWRQSRFQSRFRSTIFVSKISFAYCRAKHFTSILLDHSKKIYF